MAWYLFKDVTTLPLPIAFADETVYKFQTLDIVMITYIQPS